MLVKGPVVLISDFDGTISIDDFFWYAINEYLEDDDLKPWNDYVDGNITHVQALTRIFEKIRANKDEFDKFIDEFPIEKKFVETLKLCNQKGIEFYIVSAGADYYINRILKKIVPDCKYTLVTNKSVYSKESGLKFILHDKDYKYFDENVGVTKPGVVKDFKDKGYYCIFAGDGRPDFPAAKLADIVFARKTLLDLCKNEGLKSNKFDTYDDIYNFINDLRIE